MKNRVNKQIIKALSVGLAASMALQPMTVFAEGTEGGEPDSTGAESVSPSFEDLANAASEALDTAEEKFGKAEETASSSADDVEKKEPVLSSAEDVEKKEPVSSSADDVEKKEPVSSSADDVEKKEPVSSSADDVEKKEPVLSSDDDDKKETGTSAYDETVALEETLNNKTSDVDLSDATDKLDGAEAKITTGEGELENAETAVGEANTANTNVITDIGIINQKSSDVNSDLTHGVYNKETNSMDKVSSYDDASNNASLAKDGNATQEGFAGVAGNVGSEAKNDGIVGDYNGISDSADNYDADADTNGEALGKLKDDLKKASESLENEKNAKAAAWKALSQAEKDKESADNALTAAQSKFNEAQAAYNRIVGTKATEDQEAVVGQADITDAKIQEALDKLKEAEDALGVAAKKADDANSAYIGARKDLEDAKAIYTEKLEGLQDQFLAAIIRTQDEISELNQAIDQLSAISEEELTDEQKSDLEAKKAAKSQKENDLIKAIFTASNENAKVGGRTVTISDATITTAVLKDADGNIIVDENGNPKTVDVTLNDGQYLSTELGEDGAATSKAMPSSKLATITYTDEEGKEHSETKLFVIVTNDNGTFDVYEQEEVASAVEVVTTEAQAAYYSRVGGTEDGTRVDSLTDEEEASKQTKTGSDNIYTIGNKTFDNAFEQPNTDEYSYVDNQISTDTKEDGNTKTTVTVTKSSQKKEGTDTEYTYELQSNAETGEYHWSKEVELKQKDVIDWGWNLLFDSDDDDIVFQYKDGDEWKDAQFDLTNWSQNWKIIKNIFKDWDSSRYFRTGTKYDKQGKPVTIENGMVKTGWDTYTETTKTTTTNVTTEVGETRTGVKQKDFAIPKGFKQDPNSDTFGEYHLTYTKTVSEGNKTVVTTIQCDEEGYHLFDSNKKYTITTTTVTTVINESTETVDVKKKVSEKLYDVNEYTHHDAVDEVKETRFNLNYTKVEDSKVNISLEAQRKAAQDLAAADSAYSNAADAYEAAQTALVEARNKVLALQRAKASQSEINAALGNLETAKSALQTASDKQKTAKEDLEAAQKAKEDADQSVRDAETAKISAETKVNAADAAKSADKAQDSADAAAESAKEAAETAGNSNDDEINKAVDDAKEAAKDAADAAKEAKDAAEDAKNAAEAAKEAKEAAQKADEEALSEEDEDKKAELEQAAKEKHEEAATKAKEAEDAAKKADEAAKKADAAAQKAKDAAAKVADAIRKAAEEAANNVTTPDNTNTDNTNTGNTTTGNDTTTGDVTTGGDDTTTGGGDDDATTGGGDDAAPAATVIAAAPAAQVVTPLVADDGAAVLGEVRSTASRNTSSKSASSTDTVATDNSNGNGSGDNQTVAGTQNEETKTPETQKEETKIEDGDVALQATPELEEKGFAWWWLLAAAAVAGVSVEEYVRRKSNKAKAEAKDSTKINK